MKIASLLLVAALGALLAGCGGSGDPGTSTLNTEVQFTGDAAYNGETARIVGGHPTAIASDLDTITLSLPYGDRSLTIGIDGTQLSPGQTIPLGDPVSGTYVTYTELGGEGTPPAWASTAGSGTLTILAVDNRRVSIRLDNVALTPWDLFGENDAAGTVRLRGQIQDAPIFPREGQVDLAITSAGGTNANIEAFPEASPVSFTWNDQVTSLFLVDLSDSIEGSRSLNLSIPETIPVGQAVTLPNGDVTLRYQSGQNDWKAASGTVTVLRRAADAFEVRFTNVRFDPADDSPNATGSFVVNGTLGKE
jgi:hypothetical protein